MNKYQLLKDKQHKEFNEFPLGAAFNNEQFAEMMKKWNLTVNDTDKIISIGAGCFIRKADKEQFKQLNEKLNKEMKDAVAEDKTGDGFILDIFLYELANHEYCYTCDLEETLDALHLTIDEINSDKRLLHGLNKALKIYSKNYENM